MNRPVIDDEEEARPRFLLCAEPARADAVAAVLAVLRPVGVLLRFGGGSDRSSGTIAEIRQMAHVVGAALLIEDDVDLALKTGADGVHLRDPGLVKTVRERMSDRQILGAAARLSRHDAMTWGEQGADYVAFGGEDAPLTDEVVDLVTWWRETTVLPCLAYATDAEEVVRLASVGTDFIGVSSAIWDHADGPAAAAGLMQRAIKV